MKGSLLIILYICVVLASCRRESRILSLRSLAHKELDPRLLQDRSDIHSVSLPVPPAETGSNDVARDESTEEAVAMRQNLTSSAVVELVSTAKSKSQSDICAPKVKSDDQMSGIAKHWHDAVQRRHRPAFDRRPTPIEDGG
jgi:hypothetical protein